MPAAFELEHVASGRFSVLPVSRGRACQSSSTLWIGTTRIDAARRLHYQSPQRLERSCQAVA